MLKQTMPILAQDSEAAKRLADFLPEKIFDAHAHLLDTAHLPSMRAGLDHDLILDIETYRREMMPLLCEPKELRLNVIAFPDGAMKQPDAKELQHCDRFIVEQLEKDAGSVGEIIVSSKHSAEDLEKRLVHSRIRGFKCYHLTADRERTWDASIGEYLPESAWEVASKHRMCITLHMVKDKALADSFYWIYENDLNAFSSKTTLNHWLIALENLYAVRQAAMLADLSRNDIEDIFFNNAMRLWFK